MNGQQVYSLFRTLAYWMTERSQEFGARVAEAVVGDVVIAPLALDNSELLGTLHQARRCHADTLL